jgi:isopentenyldiphosphate isomerase/intracellular septation protein A
LDKKVLLRALLLGFIPVIAYVVVEAEFGPEWGMIAAFAWSLGEMAFIYFRERRWEKILLFDMGLIALLGTVSLIFHDDFFFKLKPAIFELIFVFIIGLSLWGNLPIIQNMSARQFRGSGISVDTDNPAFRKMLSGMFFLLLFHTLAVIWAALYSSTEMWGFISGGLLYILFGVWLGGQLLPRYFQPLYWKVRFSKDEWLPVLNPENGALLFNAPRKIVHRHGEWLHPVVHINIFNSRGEWYLQKRSAAKETFPGYWDVSVGGHVEAGESLFHAAERECEEELGLRLPLNRPPDFVYRIKMDSDWELAHVYLVKTDKSPLINRDEIEEGHFWSMEKLKEEISEGPFTPGLKAEFGYLENKGMIKPAAKRKTAAKKKKKRKK